MGASQRGTLRVIFLMVVALLLGPAALGQGGEPNDAEAAAQTSRYVFVPEQSTILQTGGFAGVNWSYAIEGQFCLSVDPNTSVASFANVDANAVDVSEPVRAVDPNQVFNMTGLTGTVLDEAKIQFTGRVADGSTVLLTLTLEEDAAYLTGETTPPPNGADFFVFTLDAVAARKYTGGTGEPNEPYQIATAGDLIALGETPEDYDKHFILTADIDLDPNLPGRRVFDRAVIASLTVDTEGQYHVTPFAGVFDGNGRSILHLTIEGEGMLGLFGLLDANSLVCDLGLEAVAVNGTGADVGALAGVSDGTVTSSHATGGVTGFSTVGGLVGRNGWGSVTASSSTATVVASWSAGGLVGTNSGRVARSQSTATVTGGSDVGGLVGYNQGDIIACHSNCNVRRGMFSLGQFGGLVGRNFGHISASHSAGSVEGWWYVGGLVGANGLEWLGGGSITDCYSTASVVGFFYVAGLVAYNPYGSIATSYSTGAVTGDRFVGGLVAVNHMHGSIAASFWDTETSGLDSSPYGKGRTTGVMQTMATFLEVGWDFVDETDNGTEDIWWIEEGQDYPRLWWE